MVVLHTVVNKKGALTLVEKILSIACSRVSQSEQFINQSTNCAASLSGKLLAYSFRRVQCGSHVGADCYIVH